MEEKEEKGRKIFISHRHTDKRIADVIKDTLDDWGRGEVNIFQSSDPKRSTRIGEHLSEELEVDLMDADVLILVYTSADQDWSYCMYECGLAAAKREQIRKIVFQCTDDKPAPLLDHVTIRAKEENEIKKFTEQFHKDSKFFPRFNEEFAPKIPEDTLSRLSDTFYKKLREVVPTRKLEERYRWDSLTLALDSTYVEKIQAEKDATTASKLAAEIIPNNCVVKKASEEAFKHFGFSKFEEAKKIGELFARWEQNAGENQKEWCSKLYTEMAGAIRNAQAEPSWTFLKSARSDVDWWYYPVVNRVRILPNNSMEFDLYLYRVPSDIVGKISSKSKKAT